MIKGMELEELEAYLDLLALPQGLLDKEPSPPKKKLKLYMSSKKASICCPCNVREAEICKAFKYTRQLDTNRTMLGRAAAFTAWSKERNKLLPENSMLSSGVTRTLIVVRPTSMQDTTYIAYVSTPKLGGSGGMPPQKNFEIFYLRECFWWLLSPLTQIISTRLFSPNYHRQLTKKFIQIYTISIVL